MQFERRVIAVFGFSADGLYCKVAAYIEEARARVYSWPEKKLLRQETCPDKVVYPVEYDAGSGRSRITPRPGQPAALITHELPEYGTVED